MARRQPSSAAQAEATADLAPRDEQTREALMVSHAAARQRRDSARLGSEEFRKAAEDVARIEIAIAALIEGHPAPS